MHEQTNKQLDGEYSERVQTPRKRFCCEHLATFATSTISRRSYL